MVLENAAKRKTTEVLLAEMEKIGYVAKCIFVNSFAFGVPQSRTRLYLLAVDPLQTNMVLDPSTWPGLLEDPPRL